MDSSDLDISEKNDTSSSSPTNSTKQYIVYGRRWIVLLCCAILAMSNTMQWLSYVSINQEVRTFYCANKTNLDCDPSFITNQIFQVVGTVTGILGMYITDKHGIRPALMIGVTCNFVGSILRLISSVTAIDDSLIRLVLLYAGTIIVSTAQCFFLILPCKIANVWFPENQRATANVIACLANPVGEIVGTLIPSLFFDHTHEFSRTSTKMMLYNGVMLSLCVIPFVPLFFIHSNAPPTPPSASKDTGPTFWRGLWACLKNKQFHAHILIVGQSFGMLWGAMVVLPDILNANGYNLSGYPIVSCAASAVLISFIAARIADRTKKFAEIMKISSVLFFLCAVGLRLYITKRVDSGWDSVVILVLCGLLGGFATLQFSIGTEIGVETTFPVYEATSAGLLVLSTQISLFIFYFLFQWIKSFDLIYTFNRGSLVGNWKLVLDVWVVITLIMAIFTIIFLRPKYKRIEYEKEKRSQQIEESPGSEICE